MSTERSVPEGAQDDLATQNKPDFWRQSAEPIEDRDAWFREAADEMKAEGAAFFQFSVHESIPHLRLVEGWKERPTKYGEPTWALTA